MIDPHSDLLRKSPLPRSAGERNPFDQRCANFLYPFEGERCRAERGGVGVIRAGEESDA